MHLDTDYVEILITKNFSIFFYDTRSTIECMN